MKDEPQKMRSCPEGFARGMKDRARMVAFGMKYASYLMAEALDWTISGVGSWGREGTWRVKFGRKKGQTL
jgi:hypothetical protein